ncbi:MAG TPA: pentapeptide repeat-containing protein, partial [Rhodospirillales bacterium]|nr:pentapeptide repeat-containing protein [Rhodospirillales bacterium]
VKFKELINFKECAFEKEANFSDANFDSSVDLTDAKFDMVPDFRRTKLSAHFTVHGVNITSQKHTDSEDSDRLCRLKELASIAKDHVREQDFFALELKAKRSHKSSSLLRYVADVIFITLYQVLSNFGRSVTVPVFWLLGIWLSCGIYFACLPCSDPVAGICKGLTTSASLIFPFLGASRASLKAGFAGSDAAVAFAEGGLGILFLFLIGLALRNRFRI